MEPNDHMANGANSAEPIPLSKADIERYSRQLLVPEIGITGQQRIRDAQVLIVGAGGLGCPVALYLAGAGIGTIGIVDYDTVSLDNLHRQIAHPESNVGQSKVESLKRTIKSLNSNINVLTFEATLSSRNSPEIFSQFDIVADCSDNAATRYLVNDACVLFKKVLVSGSALRWEGQLSVYNYQDGPCYRCLFPIPPNAQLMTNCAESGVLGPIVGLIGSMQALEIIKIVAGLNSSFASKMWMLDGLTGQTRTISLRKRDPNCAVCGENPTVKELIDYEAFCGSSAHDKIEPVHILDAADRIEAKDYATCRKDREEGQTARDAVLIDTRPPHEFSIAHLPEAINIPMHEIHEKFADRLKEKLHLRDRNKVFVICHRGNDSQKAVVRLRELFPLTQFRDIVGGYEAWAKQVDDKFPTY